MTGFKDRAILLSDRLALPRLTHGASDARLTTILFHRFLVQGENWAKARDRIFRQCEFLARHFNPVDIDTATAMIGGAEQMRDHPLLVTIDDAKLEVLEVADIFVEFGLPVALFVCNGWSGQSDEPEDVRHRLAMALRFHVGARRDVEVEGRRFTLDHVGNVDLLDALIETGFPETVVDQLRDLAVQRSARPACDWSELRDLEGQGMTLGAHSVTHGKIAHYSATRQRFEILASTETMRRHFGTCRTFAYPYGNPGTYDADTRALLVEAGLETGFITTPSFAAPGCDPLTLPRIVLPNAAMSDAVFAARVRGGGAPLTWLRERFR